MVVSMYITGMNFIVSPSRPTIFIIRNGVDLSSKEWVFKVFVFQTLSNSTLYKGLNWLTYISIIYLYNEDRLA